MSYGATGAAFIRSENRRIRCYPMIETPGALADVAAIAALPTVDGLFIGPSDLSLGRGRGLYRASAEDRQDARAIATAAAFARKRWAMPAPTKPSLQFATKYEADFVTVSDDLSALRAGLSAALAIAQR
jgi:4-hydroxy-2-oxoheptanedioate aldolase